MAKCSVDGCNNETWASGKRIKRVTNVNALKYCRKHCRRIDNYGSPEDKKSSKNPLHVRFWQYVSVGSEDECWEWAAGSRNKSGYGSIWDNDKKSSIATHRLSYEIHKGEIPAGLVVMHTCDNPKCVNPKHLVLGTYKDNTQDMLKKGRHTAYRAFGEDNVRSKLTLEQAKYINAHPELGHKQLASMFGVSPNCIRGVRIGRTWKDA